MIKKIYEYIKSFIVVSCIFFTCVSLAITVSYTVLVDQPTMPYIWKDIFRILMDILKFSVIAALISTLIDVLLEIIRNKLSEMSNVSAIISPFVKCLLIYIPFYLLMFTGKGINNNQIVIVSTAYIIAYAVILALKAAADSICRRIENANEDYESMYKAEETEKGKKK